MNLNHRLVFLILLCLSICGRLHGNPHAFKVLSEFIDRNSNLKTDDVTGERLATKRDVTNQDKEKTFDGRSDEAKVEEGREESNLSQNNFIKDTSNEAEQETEALIGRDDDVTFSRIRLPKFDDVKVNQTFSTFLPGEIEASVKVLSISPFIFEVDGLLDAEECDLLVAIAQGKGMKLLRQQISPLKIGQAEKLLRDWDYDQDGFISQNEVLLVPQLADLKMTEENVDDMFFMLKMDQNKDGKVDLAELKKTNLSKIVDYVTQLRHEPSSLRNVTHKGTWVWADEDDMLKYEKNGYFEKFHERLSTLTEIPSEIWAMSEPLQIRHYESGQFHVHRQDSEAVNRDIPCCLYGDQDKQCRICRYLSFNLFLSDVDEGGELVFPLASHQFQDIMGNSGEWQGYFLYSKTTGSKSYFSVDINFKTTESGAQMFDGHGVENGVEFIFRNAFITGETVKFEKVYKNQEESGVQFIRYHGKIFESTQIMGYWWVPGNQRMNGRFFMWNKAYELFSARAADQANRNEGCLKSTLKVKPKKGKAVFWHNHHLNPLNGMVGSLHHEAIFAHCEVKQGVKWTASSWLNIIGDGELKLRTWRRGTNLLHDPKKSKLIKHLLGTNEPKLELEEYEKDFYAMLHGKPQQKHPQSNIHHSSNETVAKDSEYQYKQPSNALQAVQLLSNDLSDEQLSVLAAKVHRILGLQCLPSDITL